VVRRGLERPDTITASAVSAREQISRALADKIRQMESAADLKQVAEEVLPQIEKFLESPEEKRLRRVRTGVVTASIGLGLTLLLVLLAVAEEDFVPFVGVGLVAFMIGLGILINGLAFTIPRKTLTDRSDEEQSQRELESGIQSARQLNQLSVSSQTTNDLAASADQRVGRPSVTEHTTHHLKPNKS
jgi:hypothetical protein